MEVLTPSSVPWLAFFPKFCSKNKKSEGTHVLHCSRDFGERNGLSGAPISMELGSQADADNRQNQLKAISSEKEEKLKDIGQLFKEAQQNILYLNKQRLQAMEELKMVSNERNSLLDRLEELEVKKEPNIRRDNISIRSDVLLRIDSLVLTGMVGSKEASELRRLVMHSRGSLADDLYDILSMNDAELLAELRHFSRKSKTNGLHIIHICTEMLPVVSVGSLASYITGLSCSLQRQGNIVEVILPKYTCLRLDEVQGLREIESEFYSYFNGQLHGNRIWTGVVCGIGVTFIQPVYYSSLFSQEKVYGYPNDFERFAYFSRASLDYLIKSGKQPDVLHIHNWQTSIVGPLFWDVHVNQGLAGTRLLLTCQSSDSHCLEQPEKLALCGLDPSTLHRADRLQDNNMAHLVNILKGGIVYSNKVIVMSSNQPKGQVINALGYGMEPTLAVHKQKLVIAPFGFEKSTWDPSRDSFLPQSYSVDNMQGKSVCKTTLQQHLDLSQGTSEILVGCIYSDFSDFDLDKLKTLVWMASRRKIQFIFMRSGQTPVLSGALQLFDVEMRNENVKFIDEYDERLLHLIISGSDIMLCQSYDDPLLQVPLKALRYGSAPILIYFSDSRLRHFGEHDNESTNFAKYINNTFGNIPLGQAMDEIKNNPSQWNRRITDAMMKDFSWDAECSDVHISAYESLKRL
ncbi:starch synthase V precursor [Dorcoceras hygrometricum]|uniref:starch synthase n=1 Tax=Dorcoceras hygrometricum TaxID=472368 RepID=A0A2Z7BMV3_9LAMI|nr:starch synthase V precursor [Dorcoceras hygrometricum]